MAAAAGLPRVISLDNTRHQIVAHDVLMRERNLADTVDAIVCTDDVAAGRPAPYMIFRAMELAGVTDVRRVLVAGDTPRDLLAGMNAGAAMVVGVATGDLTLEQLGTERHTHLLASLATLPDLIANA